MYAKGRILPLPSAAYKLYEASALKQIAEQYNGDPVSFPVNLSCVYYLGAKRKGDIVNYLQATQDILVRAKVLEDDNYTIVARLNDCACFYDKENPRVEITIRELLPFE